ncbi:M3 family oligoendopeptidase [Aestuariivirga sp.]|uniref:M3 family oligoendopeptidase n=1 Tax=Aestuariivirga sp. TaxID=2650926 RepID=UPI0025B85996|nr:M3 family oligoendopeptidase [Aestuariivirga sp.]MCA3555014.1 M3 family oligoendopeptidase [Aestuariivirga sp.]
MTAAAQTLGPLPEWNLADLYASPEDPKFAADMKKAGELAKAFAEKYRGTLASLSGEQLAAALNDYEALSDLLGRTGSYAQLYYVGDTTDPQRGKFYGDVSARLTEISTLLLFFELELNRIDDKALAEAMKVPALAHYKPWIDNLRMEKPYQLDDRLEELFLEKSQTSSAAFNRLFDETMAGLRFEVDGEKLTLEPTLNMMQSPDEAVRRKGAEALARTFGENVKLFTLITNTLARDKEISDRWRGFKDISDARHLSNRVEPEVVAALVESVRRNYEKISHRYYRMKARWLGKDKLMHWDRNAPLPAEDTREVPWADARETVLSAYGQFAPEMAAIARTFFDRRWIDAPSRPGKAPGAFAHPTVPSAHPYVLLNYLGKTRDVMTLAHELGHGVHQVLAASQGALMAQTPLTLAETASVFGEMLTFQALLVKITEPKKRKALLASKVEDMINTVVRQIAFYTFERKVHEARKEGELTPDRINAIWIEVQHESLGDAILFGPGYETFWTYIPHFIHSPFYVYAYAFGDCLVNSLYARYRESAQGFQDKYFEMLKAGGTKHHSDLLRPFGLDAADPQFWDKGLSVISGMIDELEKM